MKGLKVTVIDFGTLPDENEVFIRQR